MGEAIPRQHDLVHPDFATVLRCDTKFMEGIKRGLEARREGRLLSWDKVKAELDIIG